MTSYNPNYLPEVPPLNTIILSGELHHKNFQGAYSVSNSMYIYNCFGASQVTQTVKNLPAVREAQV